MDLKLVCQAKKIKKLRPEDKKDDKKKNKPVRGGVR